MVGRSKCEFSEGNIVSFTFSVLKKAVKYGKTEYQIKNTKGGIPMTAEKRVWQYEDHGVLRQRLCKDRNFRRRFRSRKKF